MRVAVSQWNGRVSPVFDVAERLLLVDMADDRDTDREIKRESVYLTSVEPFGRIRELSTIGADVLICGAISFALENALKQAGIQVIGFTCGNLDDVVVAFQEGCLGDDCFRMPGQKATGAVVIRNDR